MSEKGYIVAVTPYVKQSQKYMKKPEMTYEFISHTDRKRYIQFAHQAWLLGLHEDGYLQSHLRTIWNWGDNYFSQNYTIDYDFVVVRADGAIVGIILHEHRNSTIDTYVIPSWRRRGVASGMVNALRGFVGDSKVLCGWRGKTGQGWERYYERNFILYMDQPVPREILDKHLTKSDAETAFFKSLKLKMSAAYRKHKSGK
ncbi:hypothetical protein ST201phi2-1p373 [Pseudomonas phage 201phi2-1]|uniref:N-acetyltransferase domain-containing protein n=1 Tax=Pseudomonas phage 201phi2-1 TaxID=198110 RepID=B3FJN3_BP201|nr:hypothetical protein ST201phi2-1p373 [Pseudomonas phage 201phi2-1]ABY63198.1 hypothetical protein 201phi2-1p373 [Pseudomonas phage 201phi2-1]